MHPNGQLPAYEWAFGDVNPPVHAWAAWRVFQIDRKHRRRRRGDLEFLERVFHKLMLNFTWWVNRKDAQGRKSSRAASSAWTTSASSTAARRCPPAAIINQSDGTSWMAMYCAQPDAHRAGAGAAQSGLRGHRHQILRALPAHRRSHDQHRRPEGVGLWDEEDGFYYDVLNLPNGPMIPLKIRSMVGLIPLFAVETLEPELLDKLPEFQARLEWFLNYRPDLAALVSRWQEPRPRRTPAAFAAARTPDEKPAAANAG